MFATLTLLIASLLSPGRTNFVHQGNAVAILQNLLVLKEDDGTRRLFVKQDGLKDFTPGDRLSVEIVPPTKPLNRLPRVVKSITRLGDGAKTAPLDCSIDELRTDAHHLDLVRIRGHVEDLVRDEIAPDWINLVVRSSNACILVIAPFRETDAETVKELQDAEVDVTGVGIYNQWGFRMFGGMHLRVSTLSDIRRLAQPGTDRFAVPKLDFNANFLFLDSVREIRKVRGKALARWGGRHILAQFENGYVSHVELAYEEPLPAYGTQIEIVGRVTTDLFHINFTHARYRPLDAGHRPDDPVPRQTDARSLFTDERGRPRIQFKAYGDLIQLTGKVSRYPQGEESVPRFELLCDDSAVPVDISELDKQPDGLQPGCTVSVTGVYLFESDNWTHGSPPPHIRGIALVPRTADDIRVLRQPPWWTPARLLGVIGALLGALLGFVLWNRSLNRLANRRSRQLFREQIAHASANLRVDERTRLAVELHDSLSQNLSGVGFQITAAKSKQTKDAAATREHLDTAERMLTSCRTELRRCLWDLREDTLAERDLESAIAKTVDPVSGDARVAIRFAVSRSSLSDTTTHAILRIIRELVANAVAHGKATQIRIAGEHHDDRLSFSVTDNGCGFDPQHRPGAGNGHFGLSGIEERLTRCGGSFNLESTAGRGTRAVASIPIPRGQGDARE